MRDVLVLAAKRTAIGRFLGGLKDLSAVEMSSRLVAGALRCAGIPGEAVDLVVMGCALQAGLGQNPARQVLIRSGMPTDRSAYTIGEACGSGMRAVMLAAQSIRCGEAEVVVAGGMESMSRAPYLLDEARRGYRLGDGGIDDVIMRDGLQCAFGQHHMGLTAETLAAKYGITRREQDAFAFESQQKCSRAYERGSFADEILPLEIKDERGRVSNFDTDEHPRPDTSLEKLAALQPAFKPDGTVTAGNASGINDGAAVLVLGSVNAAEKLGIAPLARVEEAVAVGVAPEEMGLGPAVAVRKLLDRTGRGLEEVDLVESNEAFAAQTLAVAKDLSWDARKVNVNGGAIALGHPIGASGARILVTLVHALRQKDGRRGIATLCVGGGEGLAVSVSRDA